VRVGIYYDLRNRADLGRPWPHFYREALEQIARAEAMGIDSVWLSEHHLFEDGYLPQPLTFAAAVAARTERVRIGTAILTAPFRRPAQLAEEAAVVDTLSDGRLVLGLGAGYVNWEFDLFGVDIRRRYDLTDDMVRELRRLLGPDGPVTPPSVNRPVPMWLGYQGPKGAGRAGRLGVGLLSLDRSLLDPYRQGLEEGGHDPSTARMAGLVNLIVADDPEETFERVLPGIAHQLNTYRKGAADGTGRVPSEITVEKLRENHRKRSNVLSPVEVLTPDDAVAHLRSVTEGLPAEEVYCWTGFGNLPDDIVERHVELLSTVVRPALA
jgi:alkanesulfonate monooxygenase SsuD/methylene tetrahydromethanopterin reductase-like flavin-dependent oxidoreductase (luciferase family)